MTAEIDRHRVKTLREPGSDPRPLAPVACQAVEEEHRETVATEVDHRDRRRVVAVYESSAPVSGHLR